MRDGDIAAIRDLQLFHGVRAETFDSLIDRSFLQQFPPGVVLIEEREQADFLYVVLDGLVEMYAGTSGAATTIDLVRPVSCFILAAVLADQVYLQSARTLKKSRILLIPAERVRGAMQADTAFMGAVVRELAQAYRRTIKELKNQKLRTGAQRLANWLLRQDADHGRAGHVTLDIEKRVLAARLGMTPENLSRAFATLEHHGLKVRGARLELRDAAALRQFAKPDPLIDEPEQTTVARHSSSADA